MKHGLHFYRDRRWAFQHLKGLFANATLIRPVSVAGPTQRNDISFDNLSQPLDRLTKKMSEISLERHTGNPSVVQSIRWVIQYSATQDTLGAIEAIVTSLAIPRGQLANICSHHTQCLGESTCLP